MMDGAVEVTVNGEKKVLAGPLDLAGLLDVLGINPAAVVVEQNLQIVQRDALRNAAVRDGDVIEIIRLVGGG